MKVYLSGAISNDRNFMQKFKNYEELLSFTYDYEVVNPAKVCSMLPKTFTHSDYMRVCYALLDVCDCIYVIPEPTKSVGVELEKKYAAKRGIKRIWKLEENA